MTELLFAWPALLRILIYIFPQQKKRKVKEGGGGMLIYKLREGGGEEKKWVNSVTFIPPNYLEIMSPAFALSCCTSATETTANI